MWIKQLLSSYEMQRPADNDQELKERNLEKLGNGTATDGDIFSFLSNLLIMALQVAFIALYGLLKNINICAKYHDMNKHL